MATKTAAKRKSHRTVMYSSGGKKLYAVRDASGKFKDIQQYSRAHAMDIKRGSSDEAAAAVNKVATKSAAKVKSAAKTAKKAVARKPARKASVKRTVKQVAKRATTARKAAGTLVDRLRAAVARVRAKA